VLIIQHSQAIQRASLAAFLIAYRQPVTGAQMHNLARSASNI
jgi:hypothetical protein